MVQNIGRVPSRYKLMGWVNMNTGVIAIRRIIDNLERSKSNAKIKKNNRSEKKLGATQKNPWYDPPP
jgi:hypothetical protein